MELAVILQMVATLLFARVRVLRLFLNKTQLFLSAGEFG